MPPAKVPDHDDEIALSAPISGERLLGGLRFHFLDWGTAGKPPVLFLHGRGLNAHTFDLVCLALRDAYHCVALDQRGHGDSDWAVEYGTAAQATDIASFVEDRGWPKAVIVGMSMGGANALAYAAEHPQRVVALVLIDVGPEVRQAGRDRVRDFMSGPSMFESIDAYVERARTFNPRRDPILLRRSAAHNLRRTPDGRYTWKWDPRALPLSDADEIARRSRVLWDHVDRIDRPTLVVRGGDSDVFGPEQLVALVARLRGARSITIPGAGHNVQGDAPEALANAIRAFLRDGIAP